MIVVRLNFFADFVELAVIYFFMTHNAADLVYFEVSFNCAKVSTLQIASFARSFKVLASDLRNY